MKFDKLVGLSVLLVRSASTSGPPVAVLSICTTVVAGLAFASIDPTTWSTLVGWLVPMPTPPVARIRNWFVAVEVKTWLVELSAHTNVPA